MFIYNFLLKLKKTLYSKAEISQALPNTFFIPEQRRGSFFPGRSKQSKKNYLQSFTVFSLRHFSTAFAIHRRPKMAPANEVLFERTREALLSHAVLVPSIEERKRRAAVAIEIAKKIEILSGPTATPVFAAMMDHCARREARQKARKKT